VRTLPPKQQAVIVLRYLCDLGDDEIAQTLGTTATTVRSQAKRALDKLRAAHGVPTVQLSVVPANSKE
jgi:RNA polymerase sigma factor (sigma-70 family)